MGLLADGEPLDWDEIKPLIEKLKLRGIDQFINAFKKTKSRENYSFKWGDEIEYLLIKFDDQNRRVRVPLKGVRILKKLMEIEEQLGDQAASLWRPEFGDFMVEGSPGHPYDAQLENLIKLETDLRERRKEVTKFLSPDEHLITLPCFPRLGCLNFTEPPHRPKPFGDGPSLSFFFPDEALSESYPRFKALATNMRTRRGGMSIMHVPIFKDERTPKPFRETFDEWGDEANEVRKIVKDDHIFTDAIGCGHSCCGLQVTLQASTEEEARLLYDNLMPFTPIMLALSAATSIYRGYLTDWDARWNILSDGADDRTEEERGLRPLKEQKFLIAKTRHSTVDSYLHPENQAYNDIELQYDQDHFARLTEAGIDAPLAQHIAHLFIRDPLQVFRSSLAKLNSPIDDKDDGMEFFEDIQSTNWNNMRFKPPPVTDPHIGWRVEFRTMEPQLTDFENAAYICFVVLLSRVILSRRLSFAIPMSKNDVNIVRASMRDAVLTEKFYFRHWKSDNSEEDVEENSADNTDIRDGLDFDKKQSLEVPTRSSSDNEPEDPKKSFAEMTIDEIMNGQTSGGFPGVLTMINEYLDSIDLDLDTRRRIDQYMGLIQGRSRGDLWTLARFMRQYVQQHPSYKKDSAVSEEIAYDLMKKLNEISENRAVCPRLTGHRERSSSMQSRQSLPSRNTSQKSLPSQNGSQQSLQSNDSVKSLIL